MSKTVLVRVSGPESLKALRAETALRRTAGRRKSRFEEARYPSTKAKISTPSRGRKSTTAAPKPQASALRLASWAAALAMNISVPRPGTLTKQSGPPSGATRQLLFDSPPATAL